MLLLLMGLISCKQAADHRINELQSKVDSLEKKVSDTYVPGFGEFMSNVQVHHAKLWFAGQNGNWKLADFEIHEIEETIDAIQKYETERPESQEIPMLKPAIDSVSQAIGKKDLAQFENSYINLTNTCNNCHRATDFEFNVVKIPEAPPFSNQDFRLQAN